MLLYSGLLLVSLLHCVIPTAHDQYKQLVINNPQQPTSTNWVNPVDQVLNSDTNDITFQFGVELVNQMTILKDYCEKLGNEIEQTFEKKILELSDYQAQINHLLNTDFKDIPKEEQDRIQDGFHIMFGHLFDEEEALEDALSINCTNEFEFVMNEQMQKALIYAQAKLSESIFEFVTLVNSVVDYNIKLQSALTVCMEIYRNNNYDQLTTESTCKEIELQALMQFVNEFVIRAAGLVSSSDIQNEGSAIFGEIPPKIPEMFPRPAPPVFTDTSPSSPSSPIELLDIDGTTNIEDPTASSEEFTEVTPGEPNDHSTTPSTDKPPPQDQHPNNHPHQHPNNHSHPHTPHSSDRPTEDTTDTPYITADASSEGQPDNTDAPPTKHHFDVIIEDPVEPSEQAVQTSHSTHSVLIATVVLGSIGFAVFCAIIIVGSLIVLMKYRKSRNTSWSQLTEEQKVSLMKESGYINPTYQFFDKVTQ